MTENNTFPMFWEQDVIFIEERIHVTKRFNINSILQILRKQILWMLAFYTSICIAISAVSRESP